jgi:hypothetical protein
MATPAAVNALPTATAPMTSTPVFARSPGEWTPLTRATLGEMAGTGPETPGDVAVDGATVGGPGFPGVVVVDDEGGGGNTASTDPTPKGMPPPLVPPVPPDPLAAAAGAALTATIAGATQAAPTMTEPSRILSSISRRLNVDLSGAEVSRAEPSSAESSSRSTLPI